MKNDHTFISPAVWDLIGDMAGASLLAIEAFAAVGAMAWAILSSLGLSEISMWGGAFAGVAAGIFAAVWLIRQANSQKGSTISRGVADQDQ